MFKLVAHRKGNLTTHETIGQALDCLSGYVVMRLTKAQRAKIADDVKLYNICEWNHKNFTMELSI